MSTMRQRHTKSRRNKRRSHHALKAAVLNLCPKCRQAVLPHQVCPNCGIYNHREVIDVLKKLDKRERKKREKELAEQEKEAKAGSMEELSRK